LKKNLQFINLSFDDFLIVFIDNGLKKNEEIPFQGIMEIIHWKLKTYEHVINQKLTKQQEVA
jgi:hypothetical protein